MVDSGLTGEPTTAIASSGGNIAANSHGQLFLSTNEGTSWRAIDSGLTSGDNATISCFAVSGSNLFAGSSSYGVFLSTNNGISWVAFNTGLTSYGVNGLAVSGAYLFAGTSGGVWRRPLSDITTLVGKPSTVLPTQFDLAQNYPNPFNPTTMINYQLPKNSFVTLKVYDVLGRGVATLVNEKENAGSYSVKFDGSTFASGVYLYRLEAGSFISVKKLMVLK